MILTFILPISNQQHQILADLVSRSPSYYYFTQKSFGRQAPSWSRHLEIFDEMNLGEERIKSVPAHAGPPLPYL